MNVYKKISISLMLFIASGVLFQNCGSNSKNFSGKVLSNSSTGDGSDDGTDDGSGSPSSPDDSNTLACYFDGEDVEDGYSVTAFQNSTVPAGSSCVYEERTCEKGNLSGSFNYSTCQVNAPASCLFNGKTVASGTTVKAYVNANPAAGGSCVSQNRLCTNGTLSGSYNFSSCEIAPYASCTFNGRSIAHGESVKAFMSSTTPAGGSCTEQVRTCNNGALSGSYGFASCTPESYASCSFNGTTYAHGESVTMFAASSVPYGQSCAPQSRVCNNGTMTGSATFASCGVNAAASCLFNGQSVAHGQSVAAYASETVPYGQSCSVQSRVCSNGALSGSNSASSCKVEELVPVDVTVSVSCSINAANIQKLKVTSDDGTFKEWTLGNGNKSIPAFTTVFKSAPILFQAYSGTQLSKHRYSNQTSRSIKFESEDGSDNDYNDLVCNFTW